MIKTCSENKHLNEMSRFYYKEAETLAEYRRRLMDKRRSGNVEPSELRSLEMRIDILYSEITDLRYTALRLKKCAAPMPVSPSIAARGRDAS